MLNMLPVMDPSWHCGKAARLKGRLEGTDRVICTVKGLAVAQTQVQIRSPDRRSLQCSSAPIVALRKRCHMSQKQGWYVTCTVRPVRTAIVPLMIAPCRTHRTGRVAWAVSAIAAFECLEYTVLGFAVRRTVHLAQSHKLAVRRLALFRLETQHLVTLADTLIVGIALAHLEYYIGRAPEHLLAVNVECCRFGSRTVVVMDHVVPSQNEDEASRDPSILRRTPFAVPKARVVALRRLPPALRLRVEIRISRNRSPLKRRATR